MKINQTALFLFLIPIFLTGCVLNHVRNLDPTLVENNGQTIVVYGLGVRDASDAQWRAFGVSLDKFDTETQTAGNCFVFDRMQAGLPATPGMFNYFYFSVPPGTYVYSSFEVLPIAKNGAPDKDGDALAFNVPKGKVTYIGDFYLNKNTIEFNRDIDSFMKKSNSEFTANFKEIGLADEVIVKKPGIFLCTP